MTQNPYEFVPPAAEDLPKEALDSATRGANMLDAYALTTEGRNFLAHALVRLQRDGWLTQSPNAAPAVLPRTAGLAPFINDVDTERQAQLRKWGEQHHPDGTGLAYYVEAARVARRDCQYAADSAKGARWSLILLEEVYEALAESDPVKLRAELVQSAAVIAAWIADLDQRETPGAAA